MLVRLCALISTVVLLAGLSFSCASGPSQEPSKPAQPAAAPPAKEAAKEAPKEAAKEAAKAAPEQPKRGGTIRIFASGNPVPNPVTQPGGEPTANVNRVLYNTLTRFDPIDMSPKGDLAESWSVSNDGLIWTIKLRKNVFWHDGKPLTSQDVKFTFDSLMDKKVNARYRSNLGPIDSTQVVDEGTVKLVYKEPYAPLPSMFAHNLYILPSHLLTGKDLNEPTDFLKSPVGTGPYKFGESVPGSHFSLVAFDKYYEGRPNIDTLVYKIIPDINNRVAQMKTNELDMTVIEASQLDALKDSSQVAITYSEQENVFYYGFNNKRPPLDDKRVRQALAYALDRKAVIDAVFAGKAMIANSVVSPSLKWAFTDKVTNYAYDPEKAKQLLAEAGYKPGPDGILQKDGKPLKFSMMTVKGTPSAERMATIAQQYFKKVGVDAAIELTEFTNVWERGNKGDYDVSPEWLAMPPDPDLTNYIGTGGSVNRWGYSNPQVDTLLKQGRVEFDIKKRTEIYYKIQQIVADDEPALFLAYPQQLRAISKAVKEFPPIDYRYGLTYVNRMWLEK